MCPLHSPDSAPPPEGSPASRGRRRFLDTLLGGSLFLWFGSVLYPLVRYLIPPEEASVKESSVKLGMVGDYKNNSGTLFRIGNKPGILIRTPAGEFRAFIAICTHLDCTVQFKQDEGVIWCACHNGRYNLHGINVSGPPPRPLAPLDVVLKGEEVHVTLSS